MPGHRNALPQLSDGLFLTDGGLETVLIYHQGIDLPEFAAFVLLADDAGIGELEQYYRPYLALARDAGRGLILETPTWRASPDWGDRLGWSAEGLDAANVAAVDLLVRLRDEQPAGRHLDQPAQAVQPVVVSGCLGPRGDGYSPDELMSAEEAQGYHSTQIASFARTEADLVTAMTMTHSGEAVGVARAAAAAGLPRVISFTVETDGRLPSGELLEAAIGTVDDATGAAPAYYMVNCAHPTHVDDALRAGRGWQQRLRGLRANASTMSHAELDVAEDLDAGDPDDLGERYAALRRELPGLTVLGGCCGTDISHVEAISRACDPAPSGR